MASHWNMFVKKIYNEGKSKNPHYKFKDALKDASKRKHEMGDHSSTKSHKKRHSGKSHSRRGSRRSMSLAGGRRSRRRHSRRH